MNIIIIEDELKTAKALGQLIVSAEKSAHIESTIQSVAGAVSYLSSKPLPDLIFMDIQLGDGLCFDIFKQITVTPPVVFCTAFDEYAMEAFRSNGIDYILKPFSSETVIAAMAKVRQMKNFFQIHKNPINDLNTLLSQFNKKGKKGFLVFKNNKYITLQTENIAYFYIRNETTKLVTFDAIEYLINFSLDELHDQLAPDQFYRANRQYLVNYSAIKEVEHYLARKLFVKLVIPTTDQLIVGKDKAAAFLNWLGNR